MKILVVIPARGGSKGVPRKNIKPLNGKPLIHYSIETAREVFPDVVICVSTEDEEIRQVVESSGLKVPFLRPEELATDSVGTYEVLLHAISYYESQGIFFDYLLLLQPTSPFRTKKHIEDIIGLMKNNEGVDMVVSVRESKDNPYFMLYEEKETGLLEKSKQGNYTRRQDCPKVYAFNGSMYLMKIDSLKKQKINEFQNVLKYVMDDYYSVDIDTPRDWEYVEWILSKN